MLKDLFGTFLLKYDPCALAARQHLFQGFHRMWVDQQHLALYCLSILFARVREHWPRPLLGGRRKGGNQMSKDCCWTCQKELNVHQRH